MPDFVLRANIDHYLELVLDPNFATERRATVVKLLISEMDKLSHYPGQLEFAEMRLAKSCECVNHFKNLRDGFAHGSPERAQADRLLENVKALHQLLDQFCHRLREQIKSRSI